MGKAWKKLDLEGAGLQSVNLRLVRELRKRPIAYLLWLLFPIGAHAFYLKDRRRGTAYLALTAVALAWFLLAPGRLVLLPLAPLLVLALYDLVWIERHLVAVNKQIRMAVYLRQRPGAPKGFKGRYTDEDEIKGYVKEKERERAGHPAAGTTPESAPPKKAASFAQQEALLRELARQKQEKRR